MGETRRSRRRPFHRAFCAFERVALGAAMSMVAFVVERQLLKAVRKKGEKQGVEGPAGPARGGLTAAPHQVGQ